MDNAIEVPDAIEDIFEYFCQYLYTGDYSIPLPVETYPSKPDLEQPQVENTETYALQLTGNIFESRESIERISNELIGKLWPYPTLPGIGHHYNYRLDYSTILLAHARLHVFARKYIVGALQDISLYKMLHMLHDFPLHQIRQGDIIRVLRYSFQGDGVVYREIQEIMLHYVTLYIKHFIRNEEFEQLLLEIPSLTSVLLNALVDFLQN
ncbi:hypothetical protein BDV37DRAFT_289915 [Aspergillus pseudonomiae]|uniref:BTB domain-containing protein n=1 Tax=Aspergillus pseudonomiae TaxID=1506151 RepID=A0A5N7CTE6_9EURO|nr:uncharacterized protein BDV37DRAFT_289915 [Aspergillus pseudonomiae]KAE8396863.1 hypothetical protein BDV37DRAFT_289915 [Aspergillus pseudonomiae]